MADKSNDKIELEDGTIVGTGLWEIEDRPDANVMGVYRDSGPMYTWDQIKDIVSDPNRVPAQQRYPSSKWIKSQGQVGSCNAYAACWALARLRDIQGMSFVDFGPEGVYAKINGGRDQGSALSAGMQWIAKHGATPREGVPHQAWRERDISAEAYRQASRYKWDECYQTGDDREWEQELASGLAAGFMGVVAVQANRDFSKIDRDGVVLPTDGRGNHAVLVCDIRIRANKFEYLHAGSWGTRIHDGGYGWLTKEKHFRTTPRFHAFYLARVALGDPQGEQVP